jgi:serine phosphatase RsbU (regulator of sigma subunit)
MRRRRSYDDAVPALRESVASLEDPDDDAAIAHAITSALGVHAEVIDEGPAVVGVPDERILDLADGGRPGRRVRLRFPNPYEVPQTPLLEELVRVVAARIDALRRTEERRLGRQRARQRGALAEQLVGVTDIEQVAAALTRHVVPDVATGCRLLRTDGGAVGADLRVPASGFPAVAYTGLGDDPDRIELATELAQLALQAAATCIDVQGELFARQVLERSLLPQALLPTVGLEIGSRYRPAGGRTALAGGDFYDVVRRDGEAVLIVGDVQGKGIEAAAVTSVARHTLRAGALRGLPPAQLLSLLNDVLLYGFEEQRFAGELPAPRFLTAVVAHLRPDPRGFKVTIGRAGHQPPVVVRRDGTAELFQPEGALLGVVEDVHLDHAETYLGLGDTLLLYTDGVTEQRDSANPFDEHSLARLVRGRSDVNTADEIAGLILETVLLVTRTHQRDDVALVVARPV